MPLSANPAALVWTKWFRSSESFCASVIKLWEPQLTEVTKADISDLIRFSESLDQAIAEAISYYTKTIDHSRDLLLGNLEPRPAQSHRLYEDVGSAYFEYWTPQRKANDVGVSNHRKC